MAQQCVTCKTELPAGRAPHCSLACVYASPLHRVLWGSRAVLRKRNAQPVRWRQ